MKKGLLFGERIKVRCEYCQHGSNFDGACACSLGRHVSHYGTCRRFEYDPLKRKPEAPPPLLTFNPEDFKL